MFLTIKNKHHIYGSCRRNLVCKNDIRCYNKTYQFYLHERSLNKNLTIELDRAIINNFFVNYKLYADTISGWKHIHTGQLLLTDLTTADKAMNLFTEIIDTHIYTL